jgi:thioester reductase-like protein
MDVLNPVRALVMTGGTGFLGSHFLLQILQQRAARVFGIARSTPERAARDRVDHALKQAEVSLGTSGARTADLAVIEGRRRGGHR